MKKETKFWDFVKWWLTPTQEKIRQDLPLTQQEFAALIRVDEDTITSWKSRPEFFEVMKRVTDNILLEASPEISLAFRRKLLSGNAEASAYKFYYEKTGQFTPKSEVDVNLQYESFISKLRKDGKKKIDG